MPDILYREPFRSAMTRSSEHHGRQSRSDRRSVEMLYEVTRASPSTAPPTISPVLRLGTSYPLPEPRPSWTKNPTARRHIGHTAHGNLTVLCSRQPLSRIGVRSKSSAPILWLVSAGNCRSVFVSLTRTPQSRRGSLRSIDDCPATNCGTSSSISEGYPTLG